MSYNIDEMRVNSRFVVNGCLLTEGPRVGIGTQSTGIPPRFQLVVHRTYVGTGSGTRGGGYYIAWWGGAGGLGSQMALHEMQATIILGDKGNIIATRSGGVGGHCIGHSGLLNYSDERMKCDIEDIDDSSALEKLREIQPKTYKYKDKADVNKGRVYGFIAQQVKTVFPEAVKNLGKEFIADIQEQGQFVVSNENKFFITFTNFDTSKLPSSAGIIQIYPAINESYQEKEINYISIIDSHTIEIDTDISEHCGTYVEESDEFIEGNNVYVHSYQVDDFHLLRKESIFTLATAALQEVDRQLQAEKAKVATLETTSSTLTSELNAEKAKTATLEATVADLLARVTALESS